MDNLIKHTAMHALKGAGFEAANAKALCVFTETFALYMVKVLGNAKNDSVHSQRSKTTVIDLVNKFGLFEVRSFEPVRVEEEMGIDEEAFYSTISAPVDKFINIYEFMPMFPPLHTFRTTLIKENRVRSRARDVKERIEQKNQVTMNLFKLLRRLKVIPRYANYLS